MRWRPINALSLSHQDWLELLVLMTPEWPPLICIGPLLILFPAHSIMPCMLTPRSHIARCQQALWSDQCYPVPHGRHSSVSSSVQIRLLPHNSEQVGVADSLIGDWASVAECVSQHFLWDNPPGP
jgi:hypothetical protein